MQLIVLFDFPVSKKSVKLSHSYLHSRLKITPQKNIIPSFPTYFYTTLAILID